MAILAYAMLSVLALGANPFKGETVAPVQRLADYKGWSSHSFSSPPTHPQRSDILDHFVPEWITLKESIRQGGGRWNAVSSVGKPGVPELSRGALGPDFLAFLLIDEHSLGFYFAGLVRLVIAGVGAFLFLRLFVGSYSALFGGVVFSYCGFNAAWFYWPQVMTAAWIPWLLWSCAGWYLRRERRWILAMAVSTALLLMGGFPAVSAYGLYACILLLVVMSFATTENVRVALWLGGSVVAAIVVGLLLAAIPLLSLADMLGAFDLSYRRGGTAYRFPGDLVLLVDPYRNGLPRVETTLYSGLAATCLALVSLTVVIWSRKSSPKIVLGRYGGLLFIISVVIVFGLLPASAVQAIPAIGSSPWGRLGVLLGLSIAILASVGMEVLLESTRRSARRVVRYLVFAILSIAAIFQLFDQFSLFRKFNSVAVGRDFFPPTPAVEYIRGHLEGTQSVIADHGYMISGTLGAYGLPEWFAHGFKTKAEKEILQGLVVKPFVTATAATFPAGSLTLNNHDLYSRLGIRFALMTDEARPVQRKQAHIDNVPLPPMPQNRFAQIFRIDDPVTVSAVAVVLAIYGAEAAPSDVQLQLHDDNDVLMATATVMAGDIRDNENAVFRFKDDVRLAPGDYEIRLNLTDEDAATHVTAWYSRSPGHFGDMLRINDDIVRGALLYTLYGEEQRSGANSPWRALEGIEKDVMILENINAPRGAYFLRSLSADAPIEQEGLLTRRPDADKVVVEYTDVRQGYVIVPIRYFSGWVAEVNGVRKSTESYLGMLLAVKVDGPSLIEFSYQPDHVAWGGALMAGGLLGLFLVVGVAGREKMILKTKGVNE